MNGEPQAQRAGVRVTHVVAVGHGTAAGNAIAEVLHLRIGDIAAVRGELRRDRHAIAGQLQVAVRDAGAWALLQLRQRVTHLLVIGIADVVAVAGEVRRERDSITGKLLIARPAVRERVPCIRADEIECRGH